MNKQKFLKMFLLGAAVTGAAFWFFKSKTGRKVREDIQESLDDFYDYIRPKVRKFKKMSYRKFKEFVEDAADEFANMKDLSGEKVDEIKEQAKSFWKTFSSEKD